MSVHAVVSLPGSPYEGMEVDYHPTGALSGSPIWRLVWRSALDSGSGAWAFVGGAPLYGAVASVQRQTATNVWGDLTTVGPSVTTPAAGDYLVFTSATCVNQYAGANRVLIGAALGATDPSGWDVGADIAANAHYENLANERPMTGLSASQEIRLRYRQVNNGVNWAYRMISVIPIMLTP